MPEGARAKTVLDLEQVFKFLERFPNTKTIIINGGDPLMMPPEYYGKLISHLDQKGLQATIGMTSNLWIYYKHPSKWQGILKNERVGVCTSFEYGDQRLISNGNPLTEKKFRDIINFFESDIGYKPDFISVINETNDSSALRNVELAKDLGVECKLNYAMASGRQTRPYQLSKIYEKYLEIYDKGLMFWEYNTKQMVHRLSRGATTCPQSRSCDEGIRALNPAGDYYSCGSLADDREMPIDFDSEMRSPEVFTPLQDSIDHISLKEECFSCPMFSICNGCRKTITDMKNHGMVESHCSLMKDLAPRILEANAEWGNKQILEIRESPSHFGGT